MIKFWSVWFRKKWSFFFFKKMLFMDCFVFVVFYLFKKIVWMYTLVKVSASFMGIYKSHINFQKMKTVLLTIFLLIYHVSFFFFLSVWQDFSYEDVHIDGRRYFQYFRFFFLTCIPNSSKCLKILWCCLRLCKMQKKLHNAQQRIPFLKKRCENKNPYQSKQYVNMRI